MDTKAYAYPLILHIETPPEPDQGQIVLTVSRLECSLRTRAKNIPKKCKRNDEEERTEVTQNPNDRNKKRPAEELTTKQYVPVNLERHWDILFFLKEDE